MSVRAIVRQYEGGRRYAILCPLGHVIDDHTWGPGSGGSSFCQELTAHSHGRPNVFDRMAECCTGAGHEAAPKGESE